MSFCFIDYIDAIHFYTWGSRTPISNPLSLSFWYWKDPQTVEILLSNAASAEQFDFGGVFLYCTCSWNHHPPSEHRPNWKTTAKNGWFSGSMFCNGGPLICTSRTNSKRKMTSTYTYRCPKILWKGVQKDQFRTPYVWLICYWKVLALPKRSVKHLKQYHLFFQENFAFRIFMVIGGCKMDNLQSIYLREWSTNSFSETRY